MTSSTFGGRVELSMRALWWFEDNSIAGMARPGFNAFRWGELPFDEGIFFGWLGQYTSGPAPLEAFRAHLINYAPKVFPFFNMDQASGSRALKVFENIAGIQEVSNRFNSRTGTFSNIEVDERNVHFSVCRIRLNEEINFLKKKNIRRIVTLTERHHHGETLAEYFGIHHLAIEDLGAPKYDQVFEFSEILKKAKREKEVVAVHCLAGIGRTSTMIMAAHMAMGFSPEELKSRLAERNPSFQMLGSQAAFIQSFGEHLQTI